MDRFLLFVAFSLVSALAYAQSAVLTPPVAKSGWSVKKIGVKFSQDQDMIRGLGYDYLLGSINEPLSYDFSQLSFQEEDLHSMVCENPNLSLAFTFRPGKQSNWEIYTAAVVIFDRIDAAHYNNREEVGIKSPDYKYLNFTNTSNEVALEVGLARAIPLFKTFYFYPGVGSGIGYSFKNRMQISGHNIPVLKADDAVVFRSKTSDAPEELRTDDFDHQYEAKDAWSQRAFYSLAFGMTLFDRAELIIAYRSGIGNRNMVEGAKVPTHLRSMGVGLNWLLN